MPSITIGLALALSAAFGVSSTPTTTADTETFSDVALAPQAQTLREHVEEYFADIPVMIAVSKCESHFRQYEKDGSIYRGKINNQDVGLMQINERYHLDTAEKLGIDIYSIDGNLEYARHLYEKEGTRPWNSSAPCWSKSKAAKDIARAK